MALPFISLSKCLSSAAASPPTHAAPVHSKPASALPCDSSALSNARLVPRMKGHTWSWAQTNHYPLILSPRGSLCSGSPPALLRQGGKQCGRQVLGLWVQTAPTGTFALLPQPDWSLQASGSSMVKQSGSTHLLGEPCAQNGPWPFLHEDTSNVCPSRLYIRKSTEGKGSARGHTAKST